ncbi:MAG: ATP synthase F0 subunit B [Bacteroidetes bacterium 24-39-8]|jgi:F-type H+-transporting ATPase subunit b|nr:MAG: ATP synthase F0 subunit B [Sphingobacteriia bacterium 35-40-8]OYZ53075.1 MAG: ATP synthase F0 subunit B [Bacteroidetes bacterium 24-39-8]OZA66082.1 MAG: ATP synthase F0 subunit B [Sphingobacteriia bacterium 39-39-8]HQR92031.1 F0F1 ATP synthase subunit B [Sediminibacterium sp.]HQS53812.1 F0F1 ATP synthase subunit B [Sediminibacterium sp.]
MELLTPGLGLLVWTLVAFLLVFFILKKFAWKPILETLKERETGIAEAIASAEKIKTEMAALKNENEALLTQAREERAVLIKEAKETANKMVSEAKEKARAEYDRIVADAQSAITQQKNAALTDVKNQVGSLVIEVAEKVLRKELANKAEQEAYIKGLAEVVNMN